MALEIRPTMQSLVVNYVLTLGVLGAIVYLSLGKPQKYYYSPVYDDHLHGGDYATMKCSDCHTAAFEPVTNVGCSNSKCHQEYVPEYVAASKKVLYEGDWASVAATQPAKFAKERARNASIIYHHGATIQGKSCMECHTTHTPPPEGKPLSFDHAKASYAKTACITCHTPNQAPPIMAHAALLEGKAGDCFECHLSSNAWTENADWVGRPAGTTREDGRKPIDASFQSIVAATPAASAPDTPPVELAAAAVPAPPTPEPTPQATPEPTPVPTPALPPINWSDFWTPYRAGMTFEARNNRPVLILFFQKSLSHSNRFEVAMAQQQSLLHWIKDRYTPVRIDWAMEAELAKSFGVLSPPSLVVMNADGTLKSVNSVGPGMTEKEIQDVLSAP